MSASELTEDSFGGHVKRVYKGRRAVVLLSTAIAVTASVFTGPSSGAEPQSITAAVSGSVVFKNNPAVPVPDGSTFTGMYDSQTGAFTGELSFQQSSTATAESQTTATSALTGTVDLAANTATATTTLSVDIITLKGLPSGDFATSPCIFAPIELELSGSFDSATNVVSLTDNRYTVPPADESPSSCGGLAGGPQGFNALITGSTGNSVTYTFSLAGGAPAAPASPPAAQPVAGAPPFTG